MEMRCISLHQPWASAVALGLKSWETRSYPESLTKEELGARANISHSSGTFGTYLGKLRTLELVEGKSELKASEELFL